MRILISMFRFSSSLKSWKVDEMELVVTHDGDEDSKEVDEVVEWILNTVQLLARYPMF